MKRLYEQPLTELFDFRYEKTILSSTGDDWVVITETMGADPDDEEYYNNPIL